MIAYSLEMERKNKLSALIKAKMIKVAAVREENEDIGMESCVHKPNSKNKYCETTKRDMLMENVDQDNKAICEAIQNLTTEIATLHQTATKFPPRRLSEQSDRKHQSPFKRTNGKQCQKCRLSNPEGRCNHCLKCGSTEHWASGCWMKNVSASTGTIEILPHLEEKMDQADLFSLGSPLTGKQRQTAKLVGKRCLVRASLGGR